MRLAPTGHEPQRSQSKLIAAMNSRPEPEFSSAFLDIHVLLGTRRGVLCYRTVERRANRGPLVKAVPGEPPLKVRAIAQALSPAHCWQAALLCWILTFVPAAAQDLTQLT